MRATWMPLGCVCGMVALAAHADDLAIQSFDATGQLIFSELPTATVYQVEWSTTCTPDGWSCSAPGIPALPETGVGRQTVTVSVVEAPCFYRVSARVLSSPPTVPEGMVLIPAGSFAMGDSFSEGVSDELPVHTVQISAFCIDRDEVTKARWDDVASWAEDHDYDIKPRDGAGKAANHPVQYVKWYECVKWCNALSEKEELTPCYTVDGTVYKTGNVTPDCDWNAGGYRLPTEAEWERAARGGQSGQRFPWGGNTIQHTRANYYSSDAYSYDTSTTRGFHPDYDDGTMLYSSPVGSFAANGTGLTDMEGNLLEWCNDWYDDLYYASSPVTDPHGPAEGTRRVRRGGGWSSQAYRCRVAMRDSSTPGSSSAVLGFRTVLTPGP